MTRSSNAHMRDGFVLAESDLVDFLSGSTDSAINFSRSADLHTPIHPPRLASYVTSGKSLARIEGKDSVALVVLHPNSLFICLDLLKRSRFQNLEYDKLAMCETLLLSLIFSQIIRPDDKSSCHRAIPLPK